MLENILENSISRKWSRPPLSRMLIIHTMLKAKQFPNRRSLAHELDISEKTIQRDIDFMRDRLGLPIEYHHSKYGYYYSQPVHHFPNINISETEIAALFLAQKALELYKGTTFEKPLQTAFAKLTESLRESSSSSLEELDHNFSFKIQGVAKINVQIFEIISHSISQRKIVELTYRKLDPKEPRLIKRRVHPYHLACIQNEWYLFGYDVSRQDIRTYALPRIQRARITEESFNSLKQFSLAKHLKNSFGVSSDSGSYSIKIWFDPLAAQLIRERTWHHSQKIKELQDGSLEFSLKLGSLTEIKRWVLSYGVHAKVLQPPELIERLKAETKNLYIHYQSHTDYERAVTLKSNKRNTAARDSLTKNESNKS